MNIKRSVWLTGLLAVWMPLAAWAHGGMGAGSGFGAGFSHPFSGMDHVLAMLAVGIWSAQGSGRKVWVLPAMFVTLAVAGMAAGLTGFPLPYMEHGIAASLLVLGLLIAAAARLSVATSLLVVAFFAVFHGYAHGMEMPVASTALIYGIGFALATALLHAFGIGSALLVRQEVSRFVGIAIAMSGVYFAVV